MENAIIYRDIPRIDATLLARLHGLGVADLHDALPPIARAAGLLGSSMRPITQGLRMCGQAVTAFCAPGDSLMSHCALYLAHPGDVLVVSNGGAATGAVWGGNMAIDAKAAGIAGAVVDGPVRDVGTFRDLHFPVWASSVSVSRAEKLGRGHVNVSVACGGCVVNPGDIVVADDDGVLVFPPQHIGAVAEAVGVRAREETELHQKIQRGGRIFEIMDFGRLLECKGIKVREGFWSNGDSSAR
jgi:4-hydroxy-4-methyl-2-oxoglutarate aldolase